MKVTIGTKFRYSYADSNPEWEVKSARGRGTWDCVVVDCPDYKGTKKVFSTEEITRSLNMSQFWKQSENESESFYDRQKPGTVVHYHNSFGQFVRCVVTKDKQLLPTALVGAWKPYDLPKRLPNGEIYLGHHAKQIHEKRTFQPHVGNVYENNPKSSTFANYGNPALMTPIPLTVPDPTEAEMKEFALRKKIESIHAITGDSSKPATEILEQIKKLVG